MKYTILADAIEAIALVCAFLRQRNTEKPAREVRFSTRVAVAADGDIYLIREQEPEAVPLFILQHPTEIDLLVLP